MLPSKTIPELKNRKRHALKPKTTNATAVAAAPPRKKTRVTSGTEVEDSPLARARLGHARHSGGDAAASSITISPASSFQMSSPVPIKVRIISSIRSNLFNDVYRLRGA
jgi:hypothetical protein